MLIHLPIVMVALLPLTPVADNVPKFDIARECASEGGSAAMQASCTADEAQARDQLGPLWAQSAAADRGVCVRETSTDGSPSYVELLTCLEMSRDAKKSPK
jgi:hypothetical protein